MKQRKTALPMLWGGAALAAVCYGLGAAWLLPALLLVVSSHGAQRLEADSRWYRYASLSALAGVLLMLLGTAGILPGRAGAFLLLWPYAAIAVFALLGRMDSRKNHARERGNNMNVLVVGGGGREHAIVHTLKKSPKVGHIWCAPGNGGIAAEAECVAIKATDLDGMVAFAKDVKPDLVMVAPDDPLVLGMVDAMEAAGFRAFGPRKNAAVIEGSKSFSKELMEKYHIPTAGYAVFENSADAVGYIKKNGAPIVVKADGLALGKGVTVAMTEDEAIEAVRDAIDGGAFGASGARVVIEEFLTGPEVSVLAFVDGKTLKTMPSAQDHKRAYDGDEGPNTGGMGAFSPSRFYTDEIAARCRETIFEPTVAAMQAEGRPFKGVLYFGLMLTSKGPRVIEYNARFGDPETQAVLSLLETDLFDIFDAVIDEKLDEIDIKWADGAACCVCMASGGYPKAYEKGREIAGLSDVTDSFVFHAGTAEKDGKLVTNGGRVLGVTATAPTLDEAIRKAYADVKKIHFDGVHYRTDIGVK